MSKGVEVSSRKKAAALSNGDSALYRVAPSSARHLLACGKRFGLLSLHPRGGHWKSELQDSAVASLFRAASSTARVHIKSMQDMSHLSELVKGFTECFVMSLWLAAICACVPTQSLKS